jgi:hypothetical protein
MKAIRLLEFGEQLVFDDVPVPAIARDGALVKIKSTAVNHLDLVKASGRLRQILSIDLPWIPGHEFQESSNRLAVTLRLMSQVMPSSVQRVGRACGVACCQGSDHRKETIEPLL